MKEFEFTFKEGLTKGLRRFTTGPREEQDLVECHHLVPTEKGLGLHEAVVDLNAASVTWGGLGKWTAADATRDITIHIADYIDAAELQTVSVYIDSVLKGTTDANGELDVDGVAVGGHTLKLTKTGYLDSDADTLLNDYIVVT